MDRFHDESQTPLTPIHPREVARSAMSIIHEIGQGKFGVVSEATLQETKSIPPYLVAVKALHPRSTGETRQELLEEAAVMAQFKHPHVAALIDVVTTGNPLLVVVEFLEHGSLKSVLECIKPTEP